MKKTLDEMNERMWYRLVKVLFAISFILSFISYNTLLIADIGYKNLDKNHSTLTCHLPIGNTEKMSLAEAGLDISKYYFEGAVFSYQEFFEGYNDYKIRNILEVCTGKDTGSIDIVSLQKEFEVRQKYTEMSNEELLSSMSEDETVSTYEPSEPPEWNYRMFDIQPEFSYSQFLLYFFAGNIVIVLFFEAMRRIFYYVVLGSILPRKQKPYESD
ncbi:hypothetical protein A2837_01825 [Candidatus Kaiserbacteria bacterium RIFCSPHIGHO2_01_FULL_46_22]|uniref:Uncharacterized protein n=1 Tax=Candidatus Kaiserbacteria bacterium RIFCSPHIGHO2_01_FULL_46_22 TaxID=1798475 RepID=A0A1F6BY95_9BACT|nr:MAG: hypothetical protein A2837_01825 [Candidatus Kaiserbacteria bacterium RIFCSPHIGHO2_01_FULL_46_22]